MPPPWRLVVVGVWLAAAAGALAVHALVVPQWFDHLGMAAVTPPGAASYALTAAEIAAAERRLAGARRGADTILRAMEKDPGRRFARAGEFAAALREASAAAAT